MQAQNKQELLSKPILCYTTLQGINMKKSEYIGSPHVQGFIKYIIALANGGDDTFVQNYETKQKPVHKFNIRIFSQAYRQYSWNGKNYDQTTNKTNKLRKSIQNSLENGDQIECRIANQYACLVSALKILEWGGVYTGSVGWLASVNDDGDVIYRINQAVAFLDGDNDDDAKKLFEGNNYLRSDSGTTKIYSLASKNSIIYDNRVGAALGRIAREYLTVAKINNVPVELKFMRGSPANKTRNPSTKKYKFPVKETGYRHAQSNLRANWLLQEVIKGITWHLWDIDTNTKDITKLRAIEAALFMIGYDVNATIKHINPHY